MFRLLEKEVEALKWIFGEKFICEISLLVILHSKVGVKSSLFLYFILRSKWYFLTKDNKKYMTSTSKNSSDKNIINI